MMEDKDQNAEPDWWGELSDKEKAQIQAGIEDVKAGRVMSSEEFWRRLKEGDKK